MGRRGATTAAVAAIAGVALTAAPEAAVEGQGRPGVRVRFASLGGGGGLYGRAFLLFSSKDVEVDRPSSPPAGCNPGAVRIDATARLPRGNVRAVRLKMRLPSTDAPVKLELGDAGSCKRASLQTELEDGRTLRGGKGWIRIESLRLGKGGQVRGTFEQTVARDGGPPVSLKGSLHVPIR